MTEMAKEPTPTSEIRLDEKAVEVPVPYGGGSAYTCPNCEKEIPTRKQMNLAKPAKYAHILNDVMKCCWCSFVFSYKSTMFLLRE